MNFQLGSQYREFKIKIYHGGRQKISEFLKKVIQESEIKPIHCIFIRKTQLKLSCLRLIEKGKLFSALL